VRAEIQQRFLLIFLGALLASLQMLPTSGQPSNARQPIFPSDGQSPAQANGAELLEAVCPGHVESGEKIGCGNCASSMGIPEWVGGWSLTRVTRGHFLSSGSDDAVLSMEGCEPHSENFGGTVLLTRCSQGWSMVWYKSGVDTSRCRKVQLANRREILICMVDYGGQGIVITDLYVEDLLNPMQSLVGGSHFFEIFDNTGTCGAADDETKVFPLTRAFIEKVAFPAGMPSVVSTISVTVSFGRSSMTPEKVQACIGQPSRPGVLIPPPVRRYHIDFRFDGHDYKPTPSSAAAARMIGLKEANESPRSH